MNHGVIVETHLSGAEDGKSKADFTSSVMVGLSGLFQKSLERAFNLMVSYDPVVARHFAVYEGFVLKITCSSPAATGFIMMGDKQVYSLSHMRSEANVELQGTLSDFLLLLGGLVSDRSNDSSSFSEIPKSHSMVKYPKGMRVVGDEKTLQQLLSWVKWSEPDWESALADYTHPLLAHGLGQGARGVFKAIQQHMAHGVLNFSEYLQEERAMLPPRGMTQGLEDEVNLLQQRTLLLEKRFERLLAKSRS